MKDSPSRSSRDDLFPVREAVIHGNCRVSKGAAEGKQAQAVVLDTDVADAEVRVLVRDGGGHGERHADLEVHRRVGVFLEETGDQPRDQAVGERRRGRDAQAPGVGSLGGGRLQAGKGGEDGLDLFVEGEPFGGRFDAVSMAQEKLAIQSRLELGVARLTAGWEMPSRCAAAVVFPSEITALNTSSSRNVMPPNALPGSAGAPTVGLSGRVNLRVFATRIGLCVEVIVFRLLIIKSHNSLSYKPWQALACASGTGRGSRIPLRPRTLSFQGSGGETI